MFEADNQGFGIERCYIGQGVAAMDFILKRFEEGEIQFADHSVLSKMFNIGWAKLSKYYTVTDETPLMWLLWC